MKRSQLKFLVKTIIKEATESICGTCNGSGEGRYEGSKCPSCHGSGESGYKPKLTKHTDPDYDWDGEREERKLGIDEDGSVETTPSGLINGQSNAVAAARVNKVLSELSKGIFSDNSWEAIHKIFEKLNKLGLDVTVMDAKYGGHNETGNGMPKYKEWKISIPFTNKAGKPMALIGQITAHGAGSVEQPLDRYDITAYVSAVPASKLTSENRFASQHPEGDVQFGITPGVWDNPKKVQELKKQLETVLNAGNFEMAHKILDTLSSYHN